MRGHRRFGPLEQLPLTLVVRIVRRPVKTKRRCDAEVIVSPGGELSPSRGADDQFAAEQKRLDFVEQRVDRRVNCVGDRFDADGAAAEHAVDGLQVFAVLVVEADDVDAEHVEGGLGQFVRHAAVGLAGGVIANPAEPVNWASWNPAGPVNWVLENDTGGKTSILEKSIAPGKTVPVRSHTSFSSNAFAIQAMTALLNCSIRSLFHFAFWVSCSSFFRNGR